MAGKEDRTAQRRAQILAAAAQVFAQRGFHGARMDDIVRQSGLSKGAVYWYFRSKEEIILSILERLMRRELEGLKAHLEGQGPVRERLLAFTDQSLGEIVAMRELLPITLEFFASAPRDAKVSRALQSYYGDYQDLIARLIAQGIEGGEFVAVDPTEAAQAGIGLVEGLLLLWILGVISLPPASFRALVRRSMERLLDGMQAGG